MPPNDASSPDQPSAGDEGGEPPAPGLFARSSAALRRAGGKLRAFGTSTSGRIREFGNSTAGRLRGSIASARARWAGLPRRTRLVRGTLAMVVVVGTPLTLWERCGIMGCPDVGRLVSFQPDGAPVVLDRNGVVLARLMPVQRQVVSLADLPPHVPQAFIAVEDRRFRSHGGVDWVRVVGAAAANVRAGGVRQGSSTITMQVARNVFPDRIRAQDRTFRRKLVEARVAREIEDRFTKDQILELYLNHIYFGGGAYGVEAASRHYFGQPASELTLDQAATLAALPKAPSHYDPRRQPERSRERRDVVLTLMARQGAIDSVLAAEARREATRVTPRPSPPEVEGSSAAAFVQMVRSLLEEELGDALYRQPLRIHTTLDSGAQRVVEEEVERQLRRVESGAFGRSGAPRMADHTPGDASTAYVQGAAVVLDPSTGEVRALVGGRNPRHSSFNRAVNGRRQAGSAFKPFVFAAALSRHWSPSDRIEDSPFRLAISRDDTWEPGNFDGRFVGDLTLREALVQSRNVPTVRLIQDVGEGEVVRITRGAGIQGEVPRSPVSALGVTEVSPLELTAAYTVFANGGAAVAPRLILRVEDPEGALVWAPGPVSPRQVLHPGVAWLVTDMLRDAVDRGTGRGVRTAGFQGHAAGKSGTTNEGADAWFVGYTPGLVSGVWIGFDRPRPIAPGATGGTVAAELWGRVMDRIDTPAPLWAMPSSVVEVLLDPETGRVLEEGCAPGRGEAVREVFLAGRTPDSICPSAPGRSWFGRLTDWFRGEDTPPPEPRRDGERPRVADGLPGRGQEVGPRRDEPRPRQEARPRDQEPRPMRGDSDRARREDDRAGREDEWARREADQARRNADQARREVARARREASDAAREFQQSMEEALRDLRDGTREGEEALRELLQDLAAELEEGALDPGPAGERLEDGLRRWFQEGILPALRGLEEGRWAREWERGWDRD
jgi:1A family penicillin-binding protein